MYAGIGWRVFPVYEIGAGGACSCPEGAQCGRPGKHPRSKAGVKEASAEKTSIENWWKRWPTASIGIATGAESGLTVIDIDTSGGKPGLVNFTALSAEHGGMPGTLIAKTGGGGLHLYFTYCAALKTGANVLGEAIDVRNDGGYVIAPPSNHHSGGAYAWQEEAGELLGVPDWCIGTGGKAGKRRGRPKGSGNKASGLRIERIEELLKHIDPDDRERWLGVGVILGREFLNGPYASEAWSAYEAWAERSPKFDDDRAGVLARMKEAFYETSQGDPRTGGEALSPGSLVKWARDGGYSPFGQRKVIPYEPGNELHMAEELVRAMLDDEANRHFSVLGEVRDVVRAAVPSVRMMMESDDREPAQTLLVRRTSVPGITAGMLRTGALVAYGKNELPIGMPIPGGVAQIALVDLAHMFPPLAGVVEWPMVASDGRVLMEPRGYSRATGLYFDIENGLAESIGELPEAAEAWDDLREGLLGEFPFEDEVAEASALALFLAFMQRPMMKTCPAFSVVAPQPGTGKSTLVEVAAISVHGSPVTTHAWSLDSEELRKALHSLLIAKIPAVLFDNISRGSAVDSDHIAKLLTTEMPADRTLGSSETRREMNTLLILFTGNNIGFARDLASRVIPVRLNARTADPLGRKFRTTDIRKSASAERARWVRALLAVARAGMSVVLPEEAAGSRFEDFDTFIARPVYAVTGIDLRNTMLSEGETDSEEESEQRALLLLLWRWQEKMRAKANGDPWRIAELVASAEAKVMTDEALRILVRGVGGAKHWEGNPSKALSYALRSMNGSYRWAPMALSSKLEKTTKANVWIVKGGPTGEDSAEEGGF